MKFLSKKSVLISLPVLAALYFLEDQYFHLYYCNLVESCYYESYGRLRETFLPVLAAIMFLFLPALLTFPFKAVIFEAWKRYAIWAIPTILLLVAWIEAVGSGGGLPGQFHPRELFYPLFALIYGASSLAIIFAGWQKTRRNLPFTPASLSKIGTYITLGFVGVLFVLYFLLLSIR